MVTLQPNAYEQSAPGEDLGRFRYHTGAQPAPLAPDEPCPPLFRDVGLAAMARFLQGKLVQLGGAASPITYLRTAAYQEPYTDFGRIGRIMLLQPLATAPWHSGVESIYIAPRSTRIDRATMVFLPGEIPLADAAERFAAARTVRDIAEGWGRALYEEARIETLIRLEELESTLAETERRAAPLRKLYQSMDESERDRARAWMQQQQLSETDLCTAWHHLPAERRRFLADALQGSEEALRS